MFRYLLLDVGLRGNLKTGAMPHIDDLVTRTSHYTGRFGAYRKSYTAKDWRALVIWLNERERGYPKSI